MTVQAAAGGEARCERVHDAEYYGRLAVCKLNKRVSMGDVGEENHERFQGAGVDR